MYLAIISTFTLDSQIPDLPAKGILKGKNKNKNMYILANVFLVITQMMSNIHLKILNIAVQSSGYVSQLENKS